MKYAAIFLFFFFNVLIAVHPYSIYAQDPGKTTSLEAVIEDAQYQKSDNKKNDEIIGTQQLKLKITSKGSLQGKEFNTQNILGKTQNITYEKGDAVVVAYSKDPNGKEHVYVTDFVRKWQLMYLFFIFTALVFIVGRWRGFFSFVGLVFSFIIIMSFVIPSISLGNDPILISLLAALFIIPATFFLAHGISKKTMTAVIGTLIALVLTAILAYVFIELTKLTGYAAEEATYLQALKGNAINIKSLLLAGIIIGSLGVLDDITISQTALVEKLQESNPKFTFRQLYKSAMEVGRDHIASLVNTLILVYAGASLPLFLLFSDTKMSYATVINQEVIATEIVKTLVSSIGIVMAVPITTVIACILAKRK